MFLTASIALFEVVHGANPSTNSDAKMITEAILEHLLVKFSRGSMPTDPPSLLSTVTLLPLGACNRGVLGKR